MGRLVRRAKDPAIPPASTLRFSHYDQVIPAAVDGSGVAMGARPHLIHHLRDGTLCAPFGTESVACLGSFFIVQRPDVAATDATEAFVAWLRSEVRRDGELTLALPEGHEPGRVSGARSRVRRP